MDKNTKTKTLPNMSTNEQDQSCDSFNIAAAKKQMKNIHERLGIIISFDVGGQIYRISKDLLQQYPTTMLFMASSDIETSNDDDPIFIERNGHRFQYVLDYMHDDKINIVDSLSFFQDMEYYGFRCDHDTYFPKDVMYLDEVKYQQIRWDVSVASAGLLFECKNQVVKVDTLKLKQPVVVHPMITSIGYQPSSRSKTPVLVYPNQPSFQSWQSAMGIVGYTTGVHFWNFEIVEDDNNRQIMIGVSSCQLLVTEANYYLGGCHEDRGVGYHGETGNLYFGPGYKGAENGIAFGPTFGKGDVIGTLLNMNRRTITFYKNGVRVGTAANSNWIAVGREYFPCVSLSSLQQKIRSISHNEIFT